MEQMLQISSGAISDRGLSEKRPANEDAYLELNENGLFAVADGVGGAQAGDVASQMAMEIIGEAFQNRRPGVDPETVMASAIEKANSAIYQMARELPQLSSMATTVVALHLNGNIATIGHVGDSRLYRVDRDGDLYRETDDHSMVADEVRAGRMTEEQAENHPSRNIINRALGADETVDVDIKTIMVDGGTAFLLCSDGITRHITDQEIKGVLTFGGSPADICDYLKDLCYHRGAEDNLTAVVVKTASAQSDIHVGNQPAYAAAESMTADLEENTIPGVRPAMKPLSPLEVSMNEDDLLELGAGEPARRQSLVEMRESTSSPQVEPKHGDIHFESTGDSDSESIFQIEPPEQLHDTNNVVNEQNSDELFGTYGNGRNGTLRSKNSTSILTAAAFLVLGAILGIGAYYFAIAPKPVDTDGPKLTEMRAANIPLSAFEENRRNVDSAPSVYIARFGNDPQDCEDYYLLGRAYLLAGDYTNARNALAEARNRLSEADPANRAVLASDIAIATSVINGTTAQNMLRKELEAISPASTPSAVNSNANQ